jgi:hypothetical protein
VNRATILAAASCVALAGAIGVAAWRRAHPPPPGPLPPVACLVTIDDPSAGIARVRLELDADALRNRRSLVLAFSDVRGSDHMMRAFDVRVDGRPVAPETRLLADAADERAGAAVLVHIVRFAEHATELVITYTIDPTFYPTDANRSDPADARSRIAPDLAIIRSSSLFPRIDAGTGPVTLAADFELPPGWVAVTPWPSSGGRVQVPADIGAPAEYFALGPFETRTLTVGSAAVQVATPALVATGAFPIEAIVSRELELLDAPFKRPGPFLATVVPDAFMHGGAAGDHTIVQSSAPHVLAHEVFHWWNDGTLTGRDAAWFREGLTEYYGIRIAREAGAWTTEAESNCLADLEAEMRRLEAAGPRGLRDASLDPAARRLVYSKGALFWLLTDRQLHSVGRYLEEGVRRVVTSPRAGLTTEEIRTLFSSLYGGAVDDAFDRYVIGADRLPDLGLPAATGRSGCARD